MLLVKVEGHVVSTAKLNTLAGKKLLLVEIMTVKDSQLAGTGRHMVCIDSVGAGAGELGLAVMGSSARFAPDMAEVPTDAVIVGIIDTVQASGHEVVGRGRSA